jgi:hypothetical protein
MKEKIFPALSGRVRAWRHYDTHHRHGPTTEWFKNLTLFEWAGVVGKLLTQGDINFKIGGMYLEFENVADPDDPVSIPTFDRTGGLSYYQGLASAPTRDYLRVPLIAANLTSTDEVKFPDGNLMTFFAQSQGVVGVHGKAFSDSVNSKVFGGALVAFPDVADADQDIVHSRFYFPEAGQQVKLPTSQIGLEWDLELQ